MTDGEILRTLKIDLLISSDALDGYLARVVENAKASISNEGITLRDNVEDGMLVERYSAYIYRTRRDPAPMPRSLRWELNNRLFAEKGGGADG